MWVQECSTPEADEPLKCERGGKAWKVWGKLEGPQMTSYDIFRRKNPSLTGQRFQFSLFCPSWNQNGDGSKCKSSVPRVAWPTAESPVLLAGWNTLAKFTLGRWWALTNSWSFWTYLNPQKNDSRIVVMSLPNFHQNRQWIGGLCAPKCLHGNMWDTSQLRKMMKGLNRCSAAKRKEPRSAVWCPCWLGRIGGGTHSAQGYGMLLLWVKICQKKNNYTDKIDLAKNIPITALIPYILGDLLVILMCSPVWALCFYPLSIWELQAADIGPRCSSLCLTFSDDWRGERCLRLFVDALCGIWWNPAISIENKQRTWTGHAS